MSCKIKTLYADKFLFPTCKINNDDMCDNYDSKQQYVDMRLNYSVYCMLHCILLVNKNKLLINIILLQTDINI